MTAIKPTITEKRKRRARRAAALLLKAAEWLHPAHREVLIAHLQFLNDRDGY